jgi:hypothetical protein
MYRCTHVALVATLISIATVAAHGTVSGIVADGV